MSVARSAARPDVLADTVVHIIAVAAQRRVAQAIGPSAAVLLAPRRPAFQSEPARPYNQPWPWPRAWAN